jgi:hypothetical protein
MEIRLRLAIISALILLSTGCILAPVAYHEGNMGYPTDPGSFDMRAGVHSGVWNSDSGLRVLSYADIGASVGAKVGPVALELGGNIFTGTGFTAGLQVGVGIVGVPIMLRASAYPTDPTYFLDQPWWQFTLLGGTPKRTSGFGISGGAGVSKLGVGPMLVGEYRFSEAALRVELSAGEKAPWASSSGDGKAIMLGVSVVSLPPYDPFFGTGYSSHTSRSNLASSSALP